MATCAIWKISNRLDKVIDYATNVEKTKKEETVSIKYEDLHRTLDYIKSDYKTEEQFYVTGLNCDPKSAYEEMNFTKEFFHNTGGIQGFHAFQSFAEGEVTPEEAHELGVKLAKELWDDRFQVVVSTHLNTKHIHNHFVICSVSFVDGKKFYDTRETYGFMRHMNDEICNEYGLNVLEEKTCKYSNINYANYAKKYIKNNGYRATAKKDIDFAIRQAFSYKDFFELMQKMDYEIYERYGRISVKKTGHQPIRIERNFGDNYTIDRIKERIIEEETIRVPFIEVRNNRYIPRTISVNRKSHIKVTGFMAIYFHYYYLLKKYKDNPIDYKITTQMRADIRKMNQFSDEAKLLAMNKIENNEDLENYKNNKIREIKNLSITREKYWYKRNKTQNENERIGYCNKIGDLNIKIENLNKEVQLCRDIETRIPKMKENIKEQKELEQEQNKEKQYTKDEYNKYF